MPGFVRRFSPVSFADVGQSSPVADSRLCSATRIPLYNTHGVGTDNTADIAVLGQFVFLQASVCACSFKDPYRSTIPP